MKELGVASRPLWASLLDTKGPEIRTAMLKDHQPINLVAGQDIIIEAVGDSYVSFEGYKNDSETRIGLSYSKLCQSVSEGENRMSRCTLHLNTQSNQYWRFNDSVSML